MEERDHLASPDPHRGPYAALSDQELIEAYERVSKEHGALAAALLRAEIEHRGLAT